jgi:bifunctional non-homologous end joining protein LigD
MLLLRAESLPADRAKWRYELKLDGYRAVAFKAAGAVHLRSRNANDFSRRYPTVMAGLAKMPDGTVIDGEVVALDPDGRPSFNALQDYPSSGAPLVYYVFDLMMLNGRDLTSEPLDARLRLLETKVVPSLVDPVRFVGPLEAELDDLIASVSAQGLEGLVAKRRNSRYEPGQRSGAWMKMRVNRGQELVIGGYTVGGSTFDALVVGYFEKRELVYAARVRNGFTRATRDQVFRAFEGLATVDCPFVNLPEARSGRWGQGLTKEKMADCRWLKPVLVGQFEFVEWTADHHLRHVRFVALRDDRRARAVRRDR